MRCAFAETANEVEGHQVRWQKWSFVIGFNAREGLTLHHLRYNDAGKERSVLYRASLTEMVQQAEQVLAFMDRKGTGRLVHDDDLSPRPDRGGDLNDLLLTGR